MRKIYFFVITVVCFNFVSNAQITKGSTFLGGSVYVSSSSYEDGSSTVYEGKTSNWGITPQFGKAISTNKILGFFLNYNNRKNDLTSGADNSVEVGSSYGGGVFYRNYFPLSSRFNLFGEGTIGADAGKNERKLNKLIVSKSNQTYVSMAIAPGISFAAFKKLHLETSLNNLFSLAYQSNKTTEYNTGGTVIRKTNSRQFNAAANAGGFSNISIGLRWILPSKK